MAVYEDLTCGQLAERVQTASAEQFSAGFICNSEAAVRALLKSSREPSKIDLLLQDPLALTDALASAARAQSGSDFGLALHAIADPDSKIQNLARGQTYVCLTDGRNFFQRESISAGRGAYDRSRMTLNGLDLLRTALLIEMSTNKRMFSSLSQVKNPRRECSQSIERFFEALIAAVQKSVFSISWPTVRCTTFSALSLPARRKNSSYLGRNLRRHF